MFTICALERITAIYRGVAMVRGLLQKYRASFILPGYLWEYAHILRMEKKER